MGTRPVVLARGRPLLDLLRAGARYLPQVPYTPGSPADGTSTAAYLLARGPAAAVGDRTAGRRCCRPATPKA